MDEEITENTLTSRRRRERAVAKYLIREGARAGSADDNARQFTAGFKVNDADICPWVNEAIRSPFVLPRCGFSSARSSDSCWGKNVYRYREYSLVQEIVFERQKQVAD